MIRTLNRIVPLLVLVAVAPAQARSPLAVEETLPASTYAMLRFGGLSACSEAASGLPMAVAVGALLQRLPAEVRDQLVESSLDEAGMRVQDRLQHLGVSPADLRAVLRRPMALGIGRATLEGMGPSVAVVIDTGDAGQALARCIAAVEALVPAPETVEIHGISMRRTWLPAGLPIFAGTVGDFFVLTNSRGYLRDLIDVVRGEGRGLAEVAGLGRLRAHLPQPALASLYLNTASLCRMFDEHLPYEAAEFGEALGLGSLDGIWAAASPSPQCGSDVLHVALRGSERGIVKALTAKPADLRFAQACSPNTVLFAASSLDLPGVADAGRRLVDLLPPALRADLLRDLGRDVRSLGVQPERADALLRAFGTDVGFAVAFEKGAVQKPELLLSVGVRDAAAVGRAMQRFEALVADRLAVEWKTRRAGDRQIRFCSVELPGASMQVSPCYALLDSSLLCASDVGALVRALGQAADPQTSLAGQDDFRRAAENASGAGGFAHLRLFRGVELGWRSVETLLYPQLDAQRDRLGFGSEVLPDAEEMAAALGTTTAVCRVDDAGITVEVHGTLTTAAGLAALGRLCDEVLSRACGRIF